jgi:hypothetical protein
MDRAQLKQLAQPFDKRFIKEPPQGKHGQYVSHSTINERLLEVVGPFKFELVQIVRGHAPEIKSARKTWPAREDAIVGVVARLTIRVDGLEYHVEEVGTEDSPAMHNDAESLKNSMSDALKRCAMRFGVGLHLWSQADYYLDVALGAPERPQDAPQPPAPTPAPEREPEAPQGAVTGPQLTKLAVSLKEQGVTAEQARAFFSWLFKREITSSKQLAKQEASRVLGWDADQWSEALADYALAYGPPSEEEVPA